MTEILSELNSGNQVLIPTPDLPKFHKFVAKEKDLYSFRYTYFENKTVQITLTNREPINRQYDEKDN